MADLVRRMEALEAQLAARPVTGPALGGALAGATFDQHLNRAQATDLFLAWQEAFEHGPSRAREGGQEIAFLHWSSQFTDGATRAHILAVRTSAATISAEYGKAIASAVLRYHVDDSDPTVVMDFVAKYRTAHPQAARSAKTGKGKGGGRKRKGGKTSTAKPASAAGPPAAPRAAKREP